MTRKIIAIAAMDLNRVIGFENKIPWHIPEDFKRFSNLTKNHLVLMGSRTYWSLPDKFRPLPSRENYILTRNPDPLSGQNVKIVLDYSKFISEYAQGLHGDKILWIIGGEQIYRTSINDWDEVYLTIVKQKNQGDSFFPDFESQFQVVENQDFTEYQFVKYIRS